VRPHHGAMNSGDSWLEQLTTYPVERCAPAHVSSATRVLALFYYSYLVLSLLLLGYGARRRELWIAWFGLGLSLDALENAAAQALLRTPRLLAACGEGYAMPSTATQHAAFVTTSGVLLSMMWYAPHFRHAYYAGAHVLLAGVTASSLYFHFATPAQAFAGAALGAANAASWALAYYVLVYPRADALLANAYVRAYCPIVDTLTVSYAPVPGDPR